MEQDKKLIVRCVMEQDKKQIVCIYDNKANDFSHCCNKYKYKGHGITIGIDCCAKCISGKEENGTH